MGKPRVRRQNNRSGQPPTTEVCFRVRTKISGLSIRVVRKPDNENPRIYTEKWRDVVFATRQAPYCEVWQNRSQEPVKP